MTYALDAAIGAAAANDKVKVIVIQGAGDHFSAGHDVGSPGRDHDQSFPRVATHWWDAAGQPGAEGRMAREYEQYVDMIRRWRDVPKPTIAKVQGACLAGALAIAWSCDLIIASEDAFFADAGAQFGSNGIEYFAHPWQMSPRFAKEFLFMARRVYAPEARSWGMVNRVVPRERLDDEVREVATRIAEMSRLGLALTKRSINNAEDLMGLRAGVEADFALHLLSHSHAAEVGMVLDPAKIRESFKGQS
jgi:enoyl-CoA hydratase